MLGNGKCDQLCNNSACNYDAKECGICNVGCSVPSLGDLKCNSECMTELCEFDRGDCVARMVGKCFDGWIGDGVCNQECYTEATDWDEHDCDCAPGCTRALFTNSVCDSECASAACVWDNYVCVSYKQGICARDCFESMLGNGICDLACSTAECENDRGDCVCSPGCPQSSKGQCLSACLKPACNYDDFGTEEGCRDDFKLQLEIAAQSLESSFLAHFNWTTCLAAAPHCSEEKLKQSWVDRTCNLDCNAAQCVYDLGLCTVHAHDWCDRGFGATVAECFQCNAQYFQFLSTCTEQLPRGFERNAINPALITQLKDRSSAQSPDIIYVLQSSTPGIGTLDHPYHSIIVALAAAWQRYTVVYLSGEAVTTDNPERSAELLKLQMANEPLNNKAFKKLAIHSLACVHSDCTPTKIDVSDPIVLRVSGYVEFAHVEFTSTSSFAGMQYTYCPYLQFLNGRWQDDRGAAVYFDKFSAAKVCDRFSAYSLFIVGINGTLVFEVIATQSVNVSEFNIQPLSFIAIEGGDVLLKNVHFRNFMPRVGPVTSGFILQKGTCGQDFCGTLQFYNGSVSYLNNGYEYVDGFKLNPFVYGESLWQLNFTNITFQYNIAVEGYASKQISTSALIYLENFVFLWMENCLFYANMVTGGLLVVRSAVLIPKRINERNESVWLLYDHMVWRRLNCTANYAENGLLQTTWNKELLNVDVRDCYFARNALQSQSVISIVNIWRLMVAINGGWRNFYVPELKEMRTVWVFLRYINFTSTVFEDNSSFGSLVFIQGFANINITNITARRNGNFLSTAASLAMGEYLHAPGVYGSLYLDYINKECDALISLLSDVHFSVATNFIHGNTCSKGGSGLKFAQCSGRAAISDLTASENHGAFDEGLLIEVQGTINVTLSRLSFARNANALGPLIRFTDYSNVNFTDSVFDGNSGQHGVCLQAAEGLFLRLTSSTFTGNTAAGNLGGALLFTIEDLPRQSLFVSNCRFEGNSASEGGVIYIATKAFASLELLLLGSQFSGNNGESSSSVLRIQEGILLTETSRIEACSFIENESPRGAIYSSHSSGRLAILDSQFIENRGVVCACIALETPPAALTVLTSLAFAASKSGPAIMKLNSKMQSRLQTLSCSFIGNEKGAVMLEGGAWEDARGVFAQSGLSAVALYSGAQGVAADAVFQDNLAVTGGAVYLGSFSAFNCARCIFDSNTAQAGGAMYIEQGSAVSITWSEFKFNKAKSGGSALFVLSSPYVVSTIANSTVHHNIADSSAAIRVLYAHISLDSVELSSNEAVACPGIVLMLSQLAMRNCTLRNHTASEAGLMQITDYSVASISHSTFRDSFGVLTGAVYLTTSTLTLTDSILQNITTEVTGAFAVTSISNMLFERVVMSHIYSQSPRSLLYATDSFVTLSHCQFANYELGGISGSKILSLTIQSSTFTHGRGVLGAAVYCMQCQVILIEDSIFQDQKGTYGGALSLETLEGVSYVGQAILRRNVFEDNIAIWGAATYLNQMNTTVFQCEFIGNRAETDTREQASYGEGAGLFLDCLVPSMCRTLVSESHFERNAAELAGGAIAWKLVKPVVQNTTMLDNSAPYAPEIASFAIQLQLDAVRSLFAVSATAPGQPSTLVLVASLLDHYGHVTVLDNLSTAELASSNETEIMVTGQSKVTAVNGTFTFDDFVINASPNTTATVYLTTTAISLDQRGDTDPRVPSILLEFPMRSCVMGEINLQFSCLICSKGTYSFDPTGPCQNCPSNAVCYGNITVVPDSGNWRDDIYSETIWKCPNADACLGGWPREDMPVNLTGYCASGYRSNLCQSCDIGHTRAGKNKCGKCPAQRANVVRIVFILIAAVIIVGILVTSSLRAAAKPKSLNSIYQKILMNYLQLVLLVTEFNLNWPGPVLKLFDAQEQSGGVSEQAYSFDCFLTNNKFASDAFFVKIVFLSVLPIGLDLLLVGVWGIIAWRKKKPKLMKRELAASIVIVFFLIQPSLVKSLFSLFGCMKIKPGEYWLTSDMAIRCWDSDHYFYTLTTGVPAIILWVFGMPLLFLGVLTKHRRRHDELWIRLQFGFLIFGYKRRRFYWEFVVMLRKVLIIICAVFLNNSIGAQALTVQFVILIFLVLQNWMLPYVTEQLNSMELRAILVADVTIYCGLYYLTQDLSESATWLLFIVIVGVNAVFLGYWVRVVLRIVLDQVVVLVPWLGHRLRPRLYEYDVELEAFVDQIGELTHSQLFETRHWTLVIVHRLMLKRNIAWYSKLEGICSRRKFCYRPVLPRVVNSLEASLSPRSFNESPV